MKPVRTFGQVGDLVDTSSRGQRFDLFSGHRASQRRSYTRWGGHVTIDRRCAASDGCFIVGHEDSFVLFL